MKVSDEDMRLWLRCISTDPLVVYHGNCPDGVVALWVADRFWSGSPSGQLDAIPGVYGQQPDLEIMRGRDVVLLDFSYKRPVMDQIIDVSESVTVLDHHKTAEHELAGLPHCLFDMLRSGAGMAWDVMMNDERPWIVEYTEDHDLYRHKLPSWEEVLVARSVYPLTVVQVEAFRGMEVQQLAREGAAMLKYRNALIEQATRHRPRAVIGGHSVPCVFNNIPSIISELGHRLSQNEPFSATIQELEDGTRVYSLRSTYDGLDVSEVAKRYGGGGHRNAAGFALKPGERLSQ